MAIIGNHQFARFCLIKFNLPEIDVRLGNCQHWLVVILVLIHRFQDFFMHSFVPFHVDFQHRNVKCRINRFMVTKFNFHHATVSILYNILAAPQNPVAPCRSPLFLTTVKIIRARIVLVRWLEIDWGLFEAVKHAIFQLGFVQLIIVLEVFVVEGACTCVLTIDTVIEISQPENVTI